MSGEKDIEKNKTDPKDRYPTEIFLRDICDCLDNIFWQYDLVHSQWVYLDSPRASVTGYTPEEIEAKTIHDIFEMIHSDDSPKIREIFQQLQGDFPPNNEVNIEYRFKHKNGNWIWLSDTIKVIRDEQGKPISLAGAIKEISQIKNLEKQLSESERKYRELYENAHIALYRTRINDGKLLACNEKFVRVMRYPSKEECLKHYTMEVYNHPFRRMELLERLSNKRERFDFEIEGKRFDGSPICMKVSARIYPEQGYIEGTMIDVTAFKILTKIELNVLKLVLKGMSNKQIANQLHRSVRTIEDHRARIMRKLQANNLVELTRKAIELGINGFANKND
ncbi:MAG: PAS domain-containing protein [Phycisphaerae bacterium]|nr:PAS domain-containing protein [Phycisphaerae bacterium]